MLTGEDFKTIKLALETEQKMLEICNERGVVLTTHMVAVAMTRAKVALVLEKLQAVKPDNGQPVGAEKKE